MYTAFYGLREKPFALSPDPRFLYLAGSHREALAHLLYGIEQGEGFISITGEVGTGKTTLCRTLLERLEGNLEVAFLFNPSRTALELLQSICAEFDLPAEGLARRSLMAQLNTFLVEQKRIGRRVLLIIDEAQTLSETTLEQVRLLSNLETSREKLIQILLLGQPELDRKLDERGLRQLRQRISVRWKLDPLSAQETRAYVRHRLSVAAGEPKDLFSEAALREVHRRTGGIPRLVNQLCDRALLAGYAARAAQIGPRLVRAAAREIPDAERPRRRSERSGQRKPLSRPWFLFGSSLALVAVSLFAGLQVGRHGLTDSLRASVFKPFELQTDGTGQRESEAGRGARAADSGTSPPAVSANAPSPNTSGAFDFTFDPTSDPSDNDPSDPSDPSAGPPLIELIGYVPESVRAGLRPTPGQLGMRVNASGQLVSSETTLAIPPRPNPPETALARGLLPQLIANRDPLRSISDTQSALLARFGRLSPKLAAAPRDAADLERSFEGRGLAATRFDGGSIELLRRLDHPVVLPLSGASGSESEADQRWVAVTGFQRDRARVAGLLPDQIITVAIDELEAHWLETGIIVWERFESVPTLLTESDEGSGVLWLQRALRELRFFDGYPSGYFDETTASAVRRFQRDRGLISDGVAGPLTQIALYARLSRYPVPRLSDSSLDTPAANPTISRAAPTPTPTPTATTHTPTTLLNSTRNTDNDGAAAPARPGDRG